MGDTVMDANRARELARAKNSLSRIELQDVKDFDNLDKYIEICASNSNYSLTICYDFINGIEEKQYNKIVNKLKDKGFKVRKSYNGTKSEMFDLLISW